MKNIFVVLIILFSIISFGQDNKKINSKVNTKSPMNYEVENPIEFIKKESIGGKLDFQKKLSENGNVSDEKKRNVISIAQWTKEVYDLGIITEFGVISLWEEIYNRRMTNDEIAAVAFVINRK